MFFIIFYIHPLIPASYIFVVVCAMIVPLMVALVVAWRRGRVDTFHTISGQFLCVYMPPFLPSRSSLSHIYLQPGTGLVIMALVLVYILLELIEIDSDAVPPLIMGWLLLSFLVSLLRNRQNLSDFINQTQSRASREEMFTRMDSDGL